MTPSPDPTPAPAGLTLAEALKAAKTKGFGNQFVAIEDGRVKASEMNTTFAASDLVASVLWRIEGTSDAADQMIVVAVEAPSGERGSLTLLYGPNGSIEDDAVLQALDVSDAEPGLPVQE